jgi:HAD superfamily hydrolase (TIGR01509 family)
VSGDDPRPVLFDLDGVLIDSFEAWLRVTNRACRALGFDELTRERFRGSFGQGVEDDVDDFFPGRTFEEVDGFFHAHFLEEIEHVVVFPETGPTLRSLRKRGHPLAIVTNTRRGLAAEMLDALSLDTLVDTVVASGDAPRDKPAPDLVLLACERLGVQPGRSWFVGDSAFDREAAMAAGATFVGLGIDGTHRVERLGELLSVTDESSA